MQDHLRHMLLFRTLVDAGTLTAAAEQLSLSKSVLSQHLKALEQALGVQLLQRTTRKQVLTPAGQEFYQRCADIEHLVDVAWQTARDSQQGLSGPDTYHRAVCINGFGGSSGNCQAGGRTPGYRTGLNC